MSELNEKTMDEKLHKESGDDSDRVILDRVQGRLEYPGAVAHLGDCLDVLRTMPDESVDAIVTDPPYGLSNIKPRRITEAITAWAAG